MMEKIRVCSFTLVVTETSLPFHTPCSLPKEELNAFAIHVQMSALLELFSAMQEPK